jgi:putative methyltransferase
LVAGCGLSPSTSRTTAMIPRYVRVNTNLWTCSEAVTYFKSKGFETSDPIENEYGAFFIFAWSEVATPTGKDFWRMSTYQTFFFSTPGSGSNRKQLTVLGRLSFRTRRPVSRQLCWHKMSQNFTGILSMRPQPRETRQPTSAPCWVTKERSAPSTRRLYVLYDQLSDCCDAQLFAFERDKKRFVTLRTMLIKAGCQNVKPMNADFLAVHHDDQKYANVTHM